MAKYTLKRLRKLADEYEKDYCNSDDQQICEEFLDTVEQFLDWLDMKERKIDILKRVYPEGKRK